MIDTEIGRIVDPVERFFAFARERHSIYLRRKGILPPVIIAERGGGPFTNDPILAEYSFCCVYRELDKTTAWFRDHVRDKLKNDPAVLLATIVFRWFNRISTGETIFTQPDLFTGMTPFEAFRDAANLPLKQQLKTLRAPLMKQGPPWVTGSYVIQSRAGGDGLSKLDGVLAMIGGFTKRQWYDYAKMLLDPKMRFSLEEVCDWLEETPGLGGFMSFEIVSDLRWTAMLDRAPDINTWAHPGIGAKRGVQRILGATELADVRKPIKDEIAIETMRNLLALSRDPNYWPAPSADWPAWEMREVEHQNCEWDKMERTRLGQGRPRCKFPGRHT